MLELRDIIECLSREKKAQFLNDSFYLTLVTFTARIHFLPDNRKINRKLTISYFFPNSTQLEAQRVGRIRPPLNNA